jgi:hypothetical protein
MQSPMYLSQFKKLHLAANALRETVGNEFPEMLHEFDRARKPSMNFLPCLVSCACVEALSSKMLL